MRMFGCSRRRFLGCRAWPSSGTICRIRPRPLYSASYEASPSILGPANRLAVYSGDDLSERQQEKRRNRKMAYTAQISRAQKALCVLLVDQSSSMEDPCAGAGGVSKSKFLADVTNRVLFEMVNRSKKENQINDYFDIAMLGYSGRNRGEPLY